ncbi:MAG: helix-turn-helix domain-containing protein [Phycisphaerae bacterium]|jgi:transcriptional regulator with XRE-family HTH domain
MTFWELCKEKRRGNGWTQGYVAEQIGTHQSSISAFERGRLDVLARGKIVQLGELLGLDVEAALDDYDLSGRAGLRLCPSRDCPTAEAWPAGDRIVLAPRLVRITSRKQKYCPACGEVLAVATCPNCGIPWEEHQAVCPECRYQLLAPLTAAERRQVAEAVQFVQQRQAVVPPLAGSVRQR